jgi:PKD repeat protein
MNTPRHDPIRNASTRRGRAFRLAAWGLMLAFAAVGFGCADSSSDDGLNGTPAANFTVDQTAGAVGLVVQFTDTSTGAVDRYEWDFGDGQTSDQADPVVTYAVAGTYDVTLTVSGSRGSSTKAVPDLIEVVSPPTAGFSCPVTNGLAPITTTCTSSALNASTSAWTFTNGVDTVTSTERSPTVTLASGGVWTVTQRVENAAGVDTAESTITLEEIVITVTPVIGPGPGRATLSADTGSFTGLNTWSVDDVIISNSPTTTYLFQAPGTYQVKYEFGSLFPPITAEQTYEYVVPDVPVVVDFDVDSPDGPGPLSVTFSDLSLGQIDEWVWDFGDGTGCVFPDPGDGSVVCNDSSPTHSYALIGRYDVTLTVNPSATDPTDRGTLTKNDLVSVTILDPSFEAQTANAEIGGAWTVLRPATATATSDPVALRSSPGGTDAGMPSRGSSWASLDGLGTDGSEPAVSVENGIATRFILPLDKPVIEFDYVLLQSEPPAGLVLDAMTATVSDGIDTVEITSAAADSHSAYSGGSTRYPTLDSGTTRVTPLRTASLDVDLAFPAAGPDTEYTLTLRLTNGTNGFRSPRAYVDGIRFVDRAAPMVADFIVPSPIVTGETAAFTDATCPDPANTGCEEPSSWRWDFGTRESVVPPLSTGSAAQNPNYVFEESGAFDVQLVVRKADQESTVVTPVTVLAAPVAVIVDPVVVTPPAGGVFWLVDAESASTSDGLDPILSYSWDFAGWGTSSEANPGPVEIRQAGIWTIRLTITTESGLVSTTSVDVELN